MNKDSKQKKRDRGEESEEKGQKEGNNDYEELNCVLVAKSSLQCFEVSLKGKKKDNQTRETKNLHKTFEWQEREDNHSSKSEQKNVVFCDNDRH